MPRFPKPAPALPTLVPLRITVIHPLPGVALMLQRGRRELIPAAKRSAGAVSFDLELRLKEPLGAAPLVWLGECAQGTPDDRFVYVNSGRQAGQSDSCWDRRAKVKLAGIKPAHVRAVLEAAGQRLEARIEGAGRDGGPSCGTVPLLEGGWVLSRAAGRS